MTQFPARIDWDIITDTRSKAAIDEFSSKLLRNIKGIIFDFDGTLFDNAMLPFKLIMAFLPDIRRLWKERLIRTRLAGRDFGSAKEYYSEFFEKLGKECFRSPEYMRSWYFNRYMPRMVKVLKKHYKPRHGVQELFRMPKETIPYMQKIAIYSDYPFLKERLEALSIFPSPNVRLYGPDCFGAQKPSPRPFLEIASDFGLSPKEILVVGDRENTDGLGAYHAGMRFFCLETGNKRYLKLDPNRRQEIQEPKGPSLPMYAGTWNNLLRVLLQVKKERQDAAC